MKESTNADPTENALEGDLRAAYFELLEQFPILRSIWLCDHADAVEPRHLNYEVYLVTWYLQDSLGDVDSSNDDNPATLAKVRLLLREKVIGYGMFFFYTAYSSYVG